MSFTSLLKRAKNKTIVVKIHDDVWKGTLTAYDSHFIILTNVYALDNITGTTPADGQFILPRTGIEYIQIPSERD